MLDENPKMWYTPLKEIISKMIEFFKENIDLPALIIAGTASFFIAILLNVVIFQYVGALKPLFYGLATLFGALSSIIITRKKRK